MQPYRTIDNMIDGVVLSFTNITANRQATQIKLAASQLARELAEGIINMVNDPIIVLDADLQVVSINHSFSQHFQMTPEKTLGCKVYNMSNGQWNIPVLRKLLEEILPQHKVIEGFVLEYNFPALGPSRIKLNAHRIKTELGDTELILLVLSFIEKN